MKCVAKLRALTIPINIEGITSAEEFIAYTARVSNPGNQNNKDTADKLIRYLIKNKHWSPFEQVFMTVEINTTRDIGRQILRHRSFVFQEFSQRYATATEFLRREARLQDTKNRQNSIKTSNKSLSRRWDLVQRFVQWTSQRAYRWALNNNIAKEQARVVLPEGMTMTRMYMSGSVRSFIHYCQLRCGNGTQLEHKEVADAIMVILWENFPNIAEVLENSKTENLANEFYINQINTGSMTPNEIREILQKEKLNVQQMVYK